MLKQLQTTTKIDPQSQNNPLLTTADVQQLQQIATNLKAIQFRITKLYKNAFRSFEKNAGIQQKLRVIGRCFFGWKELWLVGKVERGRKRRVFGKLRENVVRITQRNIEHIRWLTAENCYERCLKTKIFSQWKIVSKLQKKYEELTKFIKSKYLSLLMLNCEMKNSDKMAYQIADSLNSNKKIKECFDNWVLYTKMTKVQKSSIAKYSKEVFKKLKKNQNFQTTFYKNLHKKCLLSTSFSKLHLHALTNKSLRHHQHHLLQKHFTLWVQAGSLLFHQKQQDLRNQKIVDTYLERKWKEILGRCFGTWRDQVEGRVFQRRKNVLAREFYQKKEREFLLRKYFGIVKEFKLVNRADRFYRKMLKTRVFNALKDSIIKTSLQLQKIYKFTQNRQKRKYFNSIKTFIKSDLQKIHIFRLSQFFTKFSFGLTKLFTLACSKSQKYHQQSLKFKTIYGLKQIVNITRKTNKVIIFVNVNRYLRRWVKEARVRRFVDERKFVVMGKVFREIKLGWMTGVWRRQNKGQNQQRKREKKEMKGIWEMQAIEGVTENSLDFQRLEIDSPSKLRTLEYSITAYNSNNIQNNF